MCENSDKSFSKDKESQTKSNDSEFIFDASKWHLQKYYTYVKSNDFFLKKSEKSNNLEGPIIDEHKILRTKRRKKSIIAVSFVIMILLVGILLYLATDNDEYYKNSYISNKEILITEGMHQNPAESNITEFEEDNTIINNQNNETTSTDSDSQHTSKKTVTKKEVTREKTTKKKVTTTEKSDDEYNIEYAIGGSPETNPPDPEEYDNFDDYLEAYEDYYQIFYDEQTDDYYEFYDEMYDEAYDNYYN